MGRIGRTVDKVIDGDTFKIKRNVRGSRFVRIAGVDTPEKGQRGYRTAKEFTKKMLQGKRVTLEPIRKDSYGRIVAKVYVKGKNVAKILKRKGW